MSGGGAERQLATLANELVNDYEITIVTFCDINDHYYLNPSIKRIRLGYRRSRCMICRFLRTIIYFNKVNTDVVITYGQRSSFWDCFLFGFGKA